MPLSMHLFDDRVSRYRLRLQTLTRLRWLAVVGQSVAVLIVGFGFGFSFPIAFCFALIACSACLNVFLSLRYPATHRLMPGAALAVLGIDILQLAGLLFVTGGLANPFSVLICVPVIISSASQPVRHTLLLGGLAVASVSVLAFFSLPLPWFARAPFQMPLLLHGGVWVAIVSTTAFAAFYTFRVSSEANLLADALATTELTLQREQHLSALDGLAAAAAHELGTPLATISVVAREMERAIGDDPRYREDLQLLRSQSERCRDILRGITTLSAEDDAQMRALPFSALIEEVVAPHREFGVTIDVGIDDAAARNADRAHVAEPVGHRNPGILYGLGNLVENAVDFAAGTVEIRGRYDARTVTLAIADDGPGFAPDVLAQIGEPFLTRRTRSERDGAGGLGLGLFIAKTLLERSGATLTFANRRTGIAGAVITVAWPRHLMDVAARNGRASADPVGEAAQ